MVHTACTARNTGDSASVLSILRYLLSLPSVPLDDRDGAGQTPLHYAACFPDGAAAVEMSRALLGKGADPGATRGTDGFTPLHLAAMLGRAEVISFFLTGFQCRSTNGSSSSNINSNNRNNNGSTAAKNNNDIIIINNNNSSSSSSRNINSNKFKNLPSALFLACETFVSLGRLP